MEADLVSIPSLDRLFSVLADARRRHVLAVTGDRQGPIEIDELARSIARLEHDCGSAEPPTGSVRSIVTTLHHVHLPKLSAAGFLTYDDVAGTVTRTPLPNRLESIVATATTTGVGVRAE